MSTRRPSKRLPLPCPEPTDDGRTREQHVALFAGALLVLACLLSVDLAWRFTSGSGGELAAGLIPITYLGVGWLLFLGGLAKISGARHRRSRGRGPWLVIGVLFFLLCAPTAASFVYTSEARQFTYTCTCGSNVRAMGLRNCWGIWLKQDVAVIGRAKRPGVNYPNPAACAHSTQAPWDG